MTRQAAIAADPTAAHSTARLEPATMAETRGYTVVALDGPQPGRAWIPTSPCTVGSLPGNQIALDDPTVSRFHCELTGVATGVRVRDLESKNGVVLDGLRVVDAIARHGSVLRCGRRTLRIELLQGCEHQPLSTADHFGGLRGSSAAMRAVFATLERAATQDVTVLLDGETGTGKEVAARALHDASARRHGPFVVVDCGAIPPGLIESALFGHVAGAFTGAVATRAGAFEQADGGTLFLDEIGELPLDQQPKLLRALEARQVQPVGGTRVIDVDIRVIAATHRDLRTAANGGGFRADLYFRLAVLRVCLPPLRERLEDLRPIADHLLRELGQGELARAALLTADLVRELEAATWPGNIRELRNFLERYVLLGRDAAPPGPKVAAPGVAVDIRVPLKEARRRMLDEFERQYLVALMATHDGNLSAVARAAGIGRVTLYATLERLRLR